MLVAEYLDLDVARRGEIALEEHGVVAERTGSFTLRSCDRLSQRVRCLDDAHALAATPG